MKQKTVFSFSRGAASLLIGILLLSTAANGQCLSWNQVGSSNGSTGNPFYTNMVIDRFGNQYVAFADEGNANKATVVKYNGTDWVIVGSAMSAGEADYVSLAVDSVSGTPYVAYADQNASTSVTVMKFNGTSWVPVGSPGFSPGGSAWTSIAINAHGNPYVAFEDGSIFKPRVDSFDGTTWNTVGSAGLLTGNADYESLTFHAGVPYVAYRDYNSSFGASVKKYNGTDWVAVGGTGFSGGNAIEEQLVIDASGTPYVVYQDAGFRVTVMKFNGTSWVPVGATSFSPNEADNPTIALDASGTPYVAFADYSQPNINATAMKFNGTSWVTLGNAGFSASDATYTSIAIDASGTPYVAYEDGFAATKLTVQKLMTGAPAITSLNTSAGMPTSSVTIGGTNFNTNTYENIVYFGATRATVSAATRMSLSVTVPAGATFKPVTVDNPGCGLLSYSDNPFLPTYNNGGYNNDTTNFNSQFTMLVGTNPDGVAIADLDGDGKSDLVIVNSTTGNLTVYRNMSTSGSLSAASFDGGTTINLGTSSPSEIAVGDIDGDGRPDLVISNYFSNTVSVLRNTSVSGTISFATHIDIPTGNGPNGVALADIDGDGMTDIIAVNANNANTVSVLRNQGSVGTISFAAHIDLATGTSTSPMEVAVGDIDGDGKPDIAVTNSNKGTVSVFKNIYSGGPITTASFDTRADISTGSGAASSPLGIAIADMDNDGKPDLVVVNNGDHTVSVMHNKYSSGSITTASFSTNVDFPTTSNYNIAVADINGDGRPDMVISRGTGGSIVSILLNTTTTGTITATSFTTSTQYSTGSGAVGIAVGDLDGDGLPDIAVANEFDNNVSVLRNNPFPAVPVITSVSPISAIPGQTVTITGKMFNNIAANDVVYFGATRAIVNTASSTSLTVTLPIGATYYPVSVDNIASAKTGYWQKSFMPTYNNSGYVSSVANFDPKVDLTTDNSPYGVAIGDIDGDGKADVVVTNLNSNMMSIYQNISSSGSLTAGSFAAKVDIATGGGPQTAIIEDIDGDGKPDITVVNYNDGTVSVYRNIMSAPGTITTGSFAAKVNFTTGTIASGPFGIVVGDMNGDGKPDIATANYLNNSISVIQNTSSVGSLSFTASAGFATGNFPGVLAMGDIDGDGKPELATVNFYSNTVSVYHNIATPGSVASTWFAGKQDFPTGTFPVGLAIGDMDGDGKAELVVGSSDSVSIYHNTATSGTIDPSSFASRVDFLVSGAPFSVAISDINGDGKPDLAVVNDQAGSTPGSVSVLLHTNTAGAINTGSFLAKTDFAVDAGSVWIAVGDLDGDNLPDMVVVNNGSGVNTISVLRNDPVQPISGPSTICTATSTSFSDGTIGGIWSTAGSSVAVVNANTGLVTGITTGAAVISYTLPSITLTTTVTVLASPAAIMGANNVCINATISLSDATSGGSWSSSFTSAATVNASGVVSGIEVSGASIYYTVANGCAASLNISVNPLPNNFLFGASCAPNTIRVIFDGGVLPDSIVWQRSGTTTIGVSHSFNDSVGITVAGTGVFGSSPSEATPDGIFIDGSGNLYVVDPFNNRVQEWFPGATSGITVAGTGTAGSGLNQLNSPSGVVVDASGNIYVTDGLNARVMMWAPGATSGIMVAGTGTQGSAANQLWDPAGICIDAAGNIYIADKENFRVQKWFAGVPFGVTVAGNGISGSAPNQIGNCYGIFVDVYGNLYVADNANARIEKWAPGATSNTVVAGTGAIGQGANQLYNPSAVYVDAAGNMYIADALNNRIQKWTAGATSGTTIAGSMAGASGSGPTQLNNPQSVFVDGQGNMYVGDEDNSRVLKYRDTIVNADSALIPATYDAVITSFYGCTNTTNTTTLGSGPTITVGTNPTVSLGSTTATLPFTTTGGVTMYSITYDSTASSVGFNGNLPSLIPSSPLSLDVPASLPLGTYNGTITVYNDGCNSPAVPFTVTITAPTDSIPVFIGGGFQTLLVCENATNVDFSSLLTISDMDNGQTETWSVISGPSNGTIVTGNTATSNGGIVTTSGFTYTPNASFVGTDAFTVQVDDGAGGITTTVINVYVATPPAFIFGTTTICPGASTLLTTSDAIGGGLWSSSNTAVATLNLIVPGTVVGADTGTTVISYTNGCGTVTTTVTVSAQLTGTFTIAQNPVCVGLADTFTDSESGFYLWSNGDGTTSSGSNTGIHTYSTPGSYVVTLNIDNISGCSATTTQTLTVSAAPSNITGSTTMCIGSTVHLSDATPGGTWGSASSSIAVVNPVTGVVTGQSAGTTLISYSLGASCAATILVTVIPSPTGTFVLAPAPICAGTTATLTANYPTCAGTAMGSPGVPFGSGAIHTGVVTTAIDNLTIEAWVYWNGSGGIQTIVSNGKTNNPSASGYTLTVQNGVIDVFVEGVATMASLSNLPANQWTHVALSRTSSLWQLYFNGVYVPVTHNNSTPIVPGGFFCVGTDEDGSTGTFDGQIDEVKIWSIGRSNAQIIADMNPCTTSPQAGLAGYWSFNEGTGTTAGDGSGNGNTLNLTATTWPASGAMTNTYSFATGDGGTLSGAAVETYTYNTGGVFTASITVTNGSGCFTTQTAPVTVMNYPGFISGATGVCLGGTASLTDQGTGGVWTSSNNAVATIDQNGVMSGVSLGYDTITYATGCGNVMTAAISVSNPVSGTFAINPSPLCAGTTATLTANYATCAGGAMVFNGSNSSAVLSGAVISTAVDNITMEAWVKWNGPTGGTQTIMENGTAGSSGYQFAVNNSGDLIGIIGGVTMVSSSALTAGQWIHVALVRNSGTWHVSYNGTVFSITNNITTPSTPTGNFTIGSNQSGGQSFNGTIDEAKFWTVPRGGTQVTQDMNACSTVPQAGLLGYWSFNEGSGFLANDGSGNSNTLICGSITWTTQGGDPNQYVFWPGEGSYIAGNYQQSHTYSTPGTLNTYVVVTNSEGCATSSSLTVTVYGTPAAITGTATVVAGSTIGLSDASVGGQWSSGSSAIATVDPNTGIVSGASFGTALISYTLGSGCTVTKLITVNPAPPANSVLCVGSTIQLSDGASGGTWSSTNNGIATVVANTGVVTGVTVGSLSIKHTLPSGFVVTFPITVNPLSATTGSATVCQGATTTLTNVTPGGGVWTSNNGSVATVVPSSGVVNGVSPGSAVILFTTTAGCIASKTVTVNPTAPIAGPTSVCIAQAIHLSDGVTGGTWTSSSVGVATVGATGIVTGATAGNTTIKYTLSTGCIVSSTVTVDPLSASTGSATVCKNQTITLSNITPGSGVWSSSNNSIATIGSTTGVVSGVGTGAAGMIFTTTAGCVTTKTVTVNPTAPIVGLTSVCIGQVIHLTDGVTGGTWSSSSVGVATVGAGTGVVSGATAGNTTIKYTLSTGCIVSSTVTVDPLLASTGLSTVCQGQTITLGNITPGGGAWSSGNGSVATVIPSTGVVSGAGAGTVVISFTTTPGCIATKTLTVNPTAPVTGPTSVCIGQAIHLTDGISGGTWSSGNNAVATVVVNTGAVTGATAGNAAIKYTLLTGCIVNTTVTVNALVASTGPATACQGQTITLANLTPGGGMWSSSNSSIATISPSSGVVAATNPGLTVISFTSSMGCVTSKTITVNPTSPITGLDSVAVGQSIHLSDAITGGTWSSSTNAVATVTPTTGIVTGATAGSVVINYTLPTGCVVSYVMTVNPLPSLFTVTGGGSFCAGGSGVHVGLNGSVSGVSYQLYLGSAMVNSPVAGTGGALDFGLVTAAGTYTVLATNTTTSSMSTMAGNAIVTVNPLPVAFTITGGGGYCSGGVGVHIGLSGSATSISYQLYSGISAIGSPVAGTGVALDFGLVTGSGSYTVMATNTTTGCVSVMAGSTTVTINSLPTAYPVTGGGGYCAGGTGVHDSLAASDIGVNYQLYMGATTIGSPIPGFGGAIDFGMVTTAGTYTILATNAITGCMHVMSGSAVVVINPLPAPISGTMNVCVGLTAALSDATAGGNWSSVSSGIALVGNTGIVTGAGVGVAVISYTTGSCSATTTVTVNAQPSIITGITNVCNGSSTNLSDTTSGGNWSAVSSSIAFVTSNGLVVGSGVGSTIISYTVGSCAATTTVTVNTQPSAISGANMVCNGSAIHLSDATGGGNWGSASSAIAMVGNTGIVTGAGVGSAVISYTVGSCSATTTVTVNTQPYIITGNPNVCIGSVTSLSDTTSGGNWSAVSSSIALVDPRGTVTSVGAGSTVVSYTLGACAAATTVTVNPLPSAISGTAVICSGSAANLSDGTTGGVWSSSNNTIATVIAGSGLVTGVSPGLDTISYTLTTGCMATTTISINTLPAIIGATIVCKSSTIALSDALTGGIWSSSPAGTATVDMVSGVVSGVTAGTANITYTFGTGCYQVQPITVISAIGAITGTATICGAATTNLSDVTAGGVWSSVSSGIATVSNTGVVTGVSGGTDVISYSIGTGCFATKTVTVNPASPITGPTSVCIGQAIHLSDGVSGGTWSNTNNGVATISGACVVTGATAGTTIVKYTLSTGCIESTTISVNSLTGTSGPSTVCQGQTVTLTNITIGGAGLWSSSNSSVATIGASSGIVSGGTVGATVITYTTPAGCVATNTVSVNPSAPVTGPLSVCVGQAIHLTDAVTGGTWTSTNVGAATVGAGNGVVTGATAGSATIKYTLSTGCLVSSTVTVNPLIASSGPAAACQSQTITLTNITTGGAGMWSSSNSTVATIGATTGIVGGGTAGSTVITYTTPLGCMTTNTVTVNPTAPIMGPTSVCIGTAINLTDGVTGGTWTSTNVAVATVIAGTGIVTGATAGSTTIKYTLSTGCVVTYTVTAIHCPQANTSSVNTAGVTIEDVRIFPNPNNGAFTIKGSLGITDDEEGTIEMTDMLGQVIYRKKITAHGGDINEPVQLDNTIANSMYILSVRFGSDNKMFHVVIER